MTKPSKPKIDIYAQVTDKIIASLEAGVRPWQKPWTGGDFFEVEPLRANGKPYQGINVVILWAEGVTKGYKSPYWMTFKQAKQLAGEKGGVRKGEKGTMIVFASKFAKEVKDDKSGETKTIAIPFLRGYTVFNADQIDGLPEKYRPKPIIETAEQAEERRLDRIAHVEEFLAAVGAKVRHEGGRAFYAPGVDEIVLPEVGRFKDIESYYATSGHEHIHWTGAKTRLARDFSGRFGSEAYAAEELVAEIGAAFLCAYLGITPEIRDDHAQYVQAWLKVLKNDKKFVVSAASQAQKAVEYLKGLAGELESVEETVEELEDA